MKKTFRRALVLIAVITALTVCAFAFTASAETCHGTAESWTRIYIEPTCTENGFTEYYCKDCGALAKTTEFDEPDAKDKATGHRYLATEYRPGIDENGKEYYTRVVTCQSDVCSRVTGKGHTVSECPTKYYLVEYKNNEASPSLKDVSNHADYFLKGYYVENVPSTWVVDLSDSNNNDYITKSYEPFTRVSNNPTIDYGTDITEPAFEYFKEADGTVNLYVKEGSKAYADGKAAFDGIIPVKNNDTSAGGYKFDTWVAEDDGTDISAKVIEENTVFLAKFKATENYTVTYTFKNGSTPIFESMQGVPYGSTVIYDGETPTKAKTVENSYEFAGWRVENINATDSENFAGLREPITLYHQHVIIYAQYNAVPNRYNIELVKYNGKPFEYNGQPIKKDVAFFEEIVSEDILKTLDISRPNTETYTFAETASWKIYAVNGHKVTGRDVIVGLDRLSLPQSVTVEGEDGQPMTIGYEEYDVISVSPLYKSQYRTYPITVSIMHNYFEEEDLYDNKTPRSDILDDFYVTVYNANGAVLTSGQTNSEGKVTVYIPFSTTWRFEAVTKNGKYFGATDVNPLSYDADTGKPLYEVIHIEGVGVAPSLSKSWSDGNTHSCRCVCHSFLSGLLIRIYNFIYRIFGIEYKCCDDLFAVHGDILIYD